jgi:hypothetical protein
MNDLRVAVRCPACGASVDVTLEGGRAVFVEALTVLSCTRNFTVFDPHAAHHNTFVIGHTHEIGVANAQEAPCTS